MVATNGLPADFDAVDYLHSFADDAHGCTISAAATVHAIADELDELRGQRLAVLELCDQTDGGWHPQSPFVRAVRWALGVADVHPP